MDEIEGVEDAVDAFKDYFNLSLRQFLIYDQFENIEGFNLPKFKETIEVPAHISSQEFVINVYGEEANKLILLLLKGKETFNSVYKRRET